MDHSYNSSRTQTPVLRQHTTVNSPTSPTESNNQNNRESNALRASVLDAVLQLGLGTNSTVANWMFNNPVEEEEEEALHSPALAYGTSEESSTSSAPYPITPSTSSHTPSIPKSYGQPYTLPYPGADESNQLPIDLSVHTPNEIQVRAPGGGTIAFPAVPIPPRPVTPSAGNRGKLRKKRADGYESEGGYMSEGGKKKKDKKKGSEKEVGGGFGGMDVDSSQDKKERTKEAKARTKEEKILEKKEKEEERKRKKSLISAAKGSKKTDDSAPSFTGYETDGNTKSTEKTKTKKSKSKPSGDGGYETDSGYLSSTPAGLRAKAKSRFFKLGAKQSKPELHHDESPTPSPVVEKEVVPLPIASRFATTLGSPSSVNSPSTITVSTIPPASSIDTSYVPPVAPLSSPSNPSPTPYPTPHLERVALERESYSSIDSGSSSSSAHRRRGAHFITINGGYDVGSSKISTPTSATQIPLPLSALASPASSTSKFPATSLPLTHSPASTSHALSPPLITHDITKNPSNNSLTPSQYSPQYPPSALSNTLSNDPFRASSPSLGGRPPGSPMVHFTSSPSSPSKPVRPRNPPTDGFGPRPTPSASSNRLSPGYPNTMPHRMEPSHDIVHRPTLSELTIIPSSDYIVPSPRATPLHSPNVLAYYDIPPPSPPPAGPLPSVPKGVANDGTSVGSFAQPIRPRGYGPGSIRRSRTPELGIQSMSNIQRGRESPFPSKPVVPIAGSGSGGINGLEARVKVPRYRELYALATSPEGWSTGDSRQRMRESMRDDIVNPGIHVVEPTEDGWDYDEDEEEDLRNVLDRFEDAHVTAESGRALGRSHSFEALRGRLSEFDNTSEEYLEERTSTEESGGQRSSRWSGSIYSRTSFLDPDKSGEARERFVQRVEDMYGRNGREGTGDRQAIPPVPKLPESFVGGAGAPPPGRSWNKF